MAPQKESGKSPKSPKSPAAKRQKASPPAAAPGPGINKTMPEEDKELEQILLLL